MSNSWRGALLLGGFPTTVAEGPPATAAIHERALPARIRSRARAAPLPTLPAFREGLRAVPRSTEGTAKTPGILAGLETHELIAAVYVIGAIFLLERLPVTYPRSALVAAAAVPVASLLVVAAGASLLRRFTLRRTFGFVPLRDEGRFLLRSGLTMLFVLNAHFLLKSFIYLVNPFVWDNLFSRLDGALCAGLSPSLLLTRFFTVPATIAALDFVYSVLYYVLFVFCTGLLLVLLPHAMRRTFTAAFVLLWISGSILYIAFPSWGPVFVASKPFEAVLPHMPVTVSVQSALHEELFSLVYHPLDPRVVRFGCVAAFPSLHVALIALIAIASRTVSRSWYRINLLLLALTLIGSVLTGYHYLVDGLAGLLLATACWGAGRMLCRGDVPVPVPRHAVVVPQRNPSLAARRTIPVSAAPALPPVHGFSARRRG